MCGSVQPPLALALPPPPPQLNLRSAQIPFTRKPIVDESRLFSFCFDLVNFAEALARQSLDEMKNVRMLAAARRAFRHEGIGRNYCIFSARKRLPKRGKEQLFLRRRLEIVLMSFLIYTQ